MSVEILATSLDLRSSDFQANSEYHQSLKQELRQHLARVKQGGGEEAVAKHRKRGKLLARERIERLLDPDAPFLEFSTLAAHEMYDGDAPGAGIVTGIGLAQGRE